MMTEPSKKQPSISQRLAQWLAGLKPGDLPESVRRQVTSLAMDAAGLCIAARGTDYVRAAMASCISEGSCTVIGHSRTLDAAGAALVNAIAIHGEDFDDTYEEGIVHMGAVVVPAVLAACEQFGLSGKAARLGIAAGMEIMGRLSLVAPTAIHRAGFHPTAILGPFGAVAGSGVALGLSAEQMVDAFGVAGSTAAGIIEYLADGTWTKRMHPGWAAQSGLKAALMGKNGFRGPRTVFEGKHGLFNGFAPDAEPNFERLVDGLGTVWKLERAAYKPYACGTICHPFIDCAVALSKQGVKAEQIADIVCEVGEGSVHRLWEPLEEKHRPTTPYSAKFSVPYCMAVGFTDGRAGLEQFTEQRIADPAVLGLAAKIRYVIDPNNEYPRNFTGHLKATLLDGTVHELRQPYLRGGAKAPLSASEFAEKFEANTAFGGWDPELSGKLRRFCETLPEHDDMSALRRFRG